MSFKILANQISSISFGNVAASKSILRPIPDDAVKISKIFSEEEIPLIKNKLNDFFEKVIKKEISMEASPRFDIMDMQGGIAASHPQANFIQLNKNVLTDEKYSKLVDASTGKCLNFEHLKDAQAITTRKALENYAKKHNLKNVKIVSLNKQERMNVLKSNLIHEAQHAAQANNYIKLHGVEKFADDFSSALGLNDSLKKPLTQTLEQGYAPLLNKSIDPLSEQG